MFKTKRTCLYVLFTLSCLFLLIGMTENSFSIMQQAFASEVDEVIEDEAELALTEEKRKIADAITKVYKYVPPTEATKIVDVVYKYSEVHEIEPSLLLGIIATESSFKKYARSREGAVGYTQVLPKYHQDKIKGRNIFDTYVNIQVGSTILSDCLRKHNNLKKGLGCYNGTSDSKKVKKFQTTITKRKNQILLLASL